MKTTPTQAIESLTELDKLPEGYILPRDVLTQAMKIIRLLREDNEFLRSRVKNLIRNNKAAEIILKQTNPEREIEI